METKELTEAICSFLSSKKAEDIVIADVREKTTLCDCFIIASGRNSTQVRTLCENLEEHLSKAGCEPLRTPRACATGAGGSWTTAMSSCISLTTRAASSTTSSGSGARARTFGSTRTERCPPAALLKGVFFFGALFRDAI